MGLLDGMGFDNTPQNQALLTGLLSAGFGAMAGRGTRLQAIGQGGLAGLAGYTGAIDQQQAQKARDLQAQAMTQQYDLGKLQLAAATRANDKQIKLDALPAQFMRSPEQQALSGGGGPTLANAGRIGAGGGFDLKGYSDALWGVDPTQAVALHTALIKESPFGKIDPKDYTPDSVARFTQTRNFGDLKPRVKVEMSNGVAYDPYSTQPGQVVGQDLNKPFMYGANGQVVANTPFQQFEIQKAQAGKTTVNVPVNTVKTLTQTVAEKLGGQLDTSLEGANAAAQTINTAQGLRQLLQGGKVITGPAADARMTLRQVGQVLGVGGANDAEVLANTRQAMQSMAQMELQAASAMKGQGQITESERAILRGAASGQINMTTPELVRLTQTLEKTARARIQSHQQQTQRLRAIPGAESLVPFYDVNMPQGGGTAGASVVDFGSLK